MASTPGEAILEIAPSAPVGQAARTELTEEAERLVRFMVPEATRRDVRWSS